jgi:hypothetical protein
VIIELLGLWTALETLVLEEPRGGRFVDSRMMRSAKARKEADLKRRWKGSGMDPAQMPTVTWVVKLKHKLRDRTWRYFSHSRGVLRDPS